jgi:CheY-like chemotaxis protein
VVDEYSETADVLQAVLEPRGVSVERALASVRNSPEPNSPPEHAARLSVVVVDQDTATVRGVSPQAWRDIPKIVIGTVSMPANAPRTDGAPEHYLRKPFHYADLIRAIETLIADTPE